ncbi:MAG: hypothetical protein IT338_08455 [Thermomicrobiales bacterium]|nr:hypothetical protein [Thermomicrobiales bacterium]
MSRSANSPWITRVAQALALAAMTATMAVLYGTLDYHTRWEMPHGTGYDHFLSWAGEAATLGGIALLMLVAILDGLRSGNVTDGDWLGWSSAMALLAGACSGGAALIARRYWQSLLADPTPPDVQMIIAGGLPVVAAAGTVGSILSLLVAVLMWWQRGAVAQRGA